jgi:hypothetical protein
MPPTPVISPDISGLASGHSTSVALSAVTPAGSGAPAQIDRATRDSTSALRVFAREPGVGLAHHALRLGGALAIHAAIVVHAPSRGGRLAAQ